MSWRIEKTEEGQDLVWDGVETGIAPSPFKGTANIQNANISSELGDVLASFARTPQQQVPITGGTLTPDGATLFNAPATLKAGAWIRVTASTVTSITAATSPSTVTVDYLIVGGGGGGGSTGNGGAAGGGGAGEYVAGSIALGPNTYRVQVGAKGVGGVVTPSAAQGNNGGTSSVEGIDTAIGGGGGGRAVIGSTGFNGSNGASGGGAGANNSTNGTGGTGTAGNNGGDSFASATANVRAGGGGGGSAGAGTNGTSGTAGVGGAGTSNSITGTAVIYAAGGGAGNGTAGGAGGSGVGGNGGSDSSGFDATTPGSGGGGASSLSTTGYAGGDGADGVVIIAYPKGSLVAFGGTVTQTSTHTVHTFTPENDGIFQIVSVATGGTYYVSYDSAGKIKLSANFDPTGANAITHGTTGSVTFNVVATPGRMLAKAVEKYGTDTDTLYRYYMLDDNSYLWVYDTNPTVLATGAKWMLTDPNDYSSLYLTGLAVINGWALAVGIASVYGKPTVNLGAIYGKLEGVACNEPFPTHTNFAIASNQGKVYYCDGNYIGEIFPTTSLVTSVANVQSFCSYSASTTTGTIEAVISGSLPYNGVTRMPVQFFTDQYGTLPTAITAGTVYYIDNVYGSKIFDVYTTITGNSPIDIETGAVGNQYFNTFYPTVPAMGVNGATPCLQFSSQRVNLPAYETAQTMVEVGNTIIIGGKTNILYPWNQVDAIPSDFIALPEADVKTMVNVNNMAYVFAGNKGNVYICNSAVASLALKVPDYVAGVPGTKNTYVEPYFTWGDAMYCRGKVYFSILDQTSTKAGNCGGVWSFVPSQNIDPAQMVGNALKLENQNSYGDYDGYATILLPLAEQEAKGPQYWAAWQDGFNPDTANYGIDFSTTNPVTTFVVETDILPTGTILSKNTYTQLEYKLSSPLESGESVQLFYRLNSTDAWQSAGQTIIEASNPLAGYYQMVFQKTQWVQFRAVCTTNGSTSSSFVRLQQIRLR